MCGIVGYVGYQNARTVVLDGLKTLEYRGYDSSGIALQMGGNIALFKKVGRVYALENALPTVSAHAGIGHTRWATHGEMCEKNAHPHLSFDGEFAIVHNGVIENYEELKQELVEKGVKLISSTDSEVIAHLLSLCDESDTLKKISAVAKRLEGSATFLAIKRGENAIYLQKSGASLAVGIGDGENFVASDTLAISKYTSKIAVLDDGESAKITANTLQFFKDGKPINKKITHVKRTLPKECSCHMRAEIDEIPLALARTLRQVKKHLDDELKNTILNAKRIYFCGCGTAYHACMYAKTVFERLLNIPCECAVASEFDQVKFLSPECVGVFISQSGETQDTLLALKRMKTFNAKTIAITNVEESAITRLADKTIPLGAGAEIAVAATKSYVCQLYVLYLTAHILSGTKAQSISQITNVIRTLKEQSAYQDRIKSARVFFIGKGIDYITAKEGALKLKEITYKSADAYQAGELKHGTIALIDQASVVVGIITSEQQKRRMQTTISELRSRGAYVIALSCLKGITADKVIEIPCLDDELCYPLVSVVPLQELALDCALCLNLNPDKPRNLAKSVTVI